MIPIKFRGKRTDNGKWVYGGFMQTPEATFVIDYSVVVQKAKAGYPTVYDVVEVIPETVGQQTGLKDTKTQKGVYQGDIVDFDNSEIGGKKHRGEIVWNDDQTLGSLEWGIWTKNGYLRTDFLGKLEVVGNIHSNPKLLEEKQ